MKSKRLPFDSSKQFISSKPFRFAGRNFSANDPFPWRKIGCSIRKLQQMYDMRKISIISHEETEEMEEKIDRKKKILPKPKGRRARRREER